MSILGLVKDVIDGRTGASSNFHAIHSYTVNVKEKTANVQFATYASVDAYKGGYEPINGYSVSARFNLENVDTVTLDDLYKARINYLDALNYSEDVASILADAKEYVEKGE